MKENKFTSDLVKEDQKKQKDQEKEKILKTARTKGLITYSQTIDWQLASEKWTLQKKNGYQFRILYSG